MKLDQIEESVSFLSRWLEGRRPVTSVILGSGLDGLTQSLNDPIKIPYTCLPDFPAPTAVGHSGELYCGQITNQQVLIFKGRFHCYEGYTAWQVSALVRLASALGCRKVLLTNAVGGLLAGMEPGDFMLVQDHLNFTGQNPLVGQQHPFVDLSQLYDQSLLEVLQERAENLETRVHHGVLAWMLGPSYETPAEIRALQQLGVAAVSMSTVPEAIVARYLGMKVMALSFVSNRAAGLEQNKLSHEDVLAAGEKARQTFPALVSEIVSRWSN